MISTSMIVDDIYNIKGFRSTKYDYHSTVMDADGLVAQNTYIILDEQNTLIDILRPRETKMYINEVLNILNGRKLDNIILNHLERDDFSVISEIVKKYPNVNIYISSKAEDSFADNYIPIQFTRIDSNDEISTGRFTFEFIHTPFIHTKEHMITYLKEEKILFSNDIFGSLIDDLIHYDDEHSLEYLMGPVKTFYGNVLLPRAKFIKKKLEDISEKEIKYICPSFGVIWKKYINDIMVAYYGWTTNEKQKKAVLVYDSVLGMTEKMSDHVYKALIDNGFEVKGYKLSDASDAQIMAEIIDAKAILVGASAFHNAMAPSVARFLERIYGLKPSNIYGYVFGSFCEYQGHLKRVEARLQETGVETIDTVSDFIDLDKTPEEKAYLSASEFALTIKRK